MAKNLKPLEKKNWSQNFTLVGVAKVNEYTFKIDEHSQKSDWIYNSLNLGVDCGEKHGVVYSELMGGYGLGRDNYLYVHGKKQDGKDDFENSYTIDWEDRLDEDTLKELGDLCFIKIGIEKDIKGNTVTNKFLSPYDAIAHLNENLEDGMVVNVKGQLKYSLYDGNLQVKKEINSIYLSKAEPKDYKASFLQTMLLNKDSVGKADKEKKVIPITGFLLEKFKEFNGNDLTMKGKVKGGQFVPLRKTFEFDYSSFKPEQVKKIVDKYFKVKKNVTQLTIEGHFVEGGSTVTTTLDDIPDDIKVLIEEGFYDEEELLSKCSENTGRERRMIIKKPYIKLEEKDEQKIPVIQKFDNRFSDEDLTPEYLISHEAEDEEEYEDDDDTPPFEEETASDEYDEDAWMNDL